MRDWRTFRLDRLVPSAPSGPRFAPRDVPDDLLLSGGSPTAITARPYPFRCRITALGSASAVGERVTTTRGQARALDASSCEVVGGSASLEEMAMWVARLGFEVIVHEPAALLGHLSALAQRLERAARTPATP